MARRKERRRPRRLFKTNCRRGRRRSCLRAFVVNLSLMPERRDIADVPVALLAGGLATRLRPVTEKIPKALVELAGKPFVDHQLELLRRNGIRKVVFCLGFLGEMVEQHLVDGS